MALYERDKEIAFLRESTQPMNDWKTRSFELVMADVAEKHGVLY